MLGGTHEPLELCSRLQSLHFDGLEKLNIDAALLLGARYPGEHPTKTVTISDERLAYAFDFLARWISH